MTDAERWALVLRTTWLIDLWMARWNIRRTERADVLQECRITLFRKALAFDPKRGAWTTFASWWIRNAMHAYMRTWPMFGPHNPRTPPRERVGLFERLYSSEDDMVGAVDERTRTRRLAAAIERLPELDQRTLAQRSTGRTLLDIGLEEGVSREAIRLREERALRRVREAIGT